MSAEQARARREMPQSEVVRLDELVNWQDGAVVSRTLLKRDAGTVTVFAFDEGQGLSEHTAPFDALVQVLEGSAEITVSGKRLHVRLGDAVLLPANQPHAVKAATCLKLLLTLIRS